MQADLREVSPTIFLGVPRIWEKMNAQVSVKMQDSSWLKRRLYAYFTRPGAPTGRIARALGDVLVYRPLQERLGLRRCKWALTGAAPISADLIRWYHRIGVPLLEGYGQTECGGISHINMPGANRVGTVGTSVPLVEHRIADDGEILVRGPNVFRGYLNKPAATAETIDADGWLHTGDIGAIDADGYLTITGRKKEIIITAGGKNLSPEKIENALKTSPYIKEAISIGDRRKFVGALVQIELDNVGNWATRRGLPYTSYQDLAAKPEAVDLIAKEIDTANELLVPVEQVKAFRILPKELNQDDGELTATQKVRRREVGSRARRPWKGPMMRQARRLAADIRLWLGRLRGAERGHALLPRFGVPFESLTRPRLPPVLSSAVDRDAIACAVLVRRVTPG